MGVGAVEEYNALFSPLFVSSYKVASPYCYRCPVGKERGTCNVDCIGSLEETLEKHSDDIAALILEPMMMGAAVASSMRVKALPSTMEMPMVSK